MGNFWDELMEDEEHASTYMLTYGEGPGCETRLTIGSFINFGESVLDVGCGPGWNLDHFQEFGPEIRAYRGLDYSELMVKVANQRHYVNGQQQSRFRKGDARKLKEGDRSWDVVILQDCLEHTNGYEKPVREALRVAKKRVIISFWHLEDTDNPHINDDGNDGWGAWYDKQEWERFLNSLDYSWFDLESSPEANRPHLFYIIDKQEQHG
jgi:ubiquinone/menaquinone biosynthesis C-methylase UbiE